MGFCKVEVLFTPLVGSPKFQLQETRLPELGVDASVKDTVFMAQVGVVYVNEPVGNSSMITVTVPDCG